MSTQSGGWHDRERNELEMKKSAIASMQSEYGLTSAQMTLWDVGGVGIGSAAEKRRRALSMAGFSPSEFAEEGYSSSLFKSTDVNGNATIYIQEGQRLPQDVMNWLEDLVQSPNIRMGPELQAQYDALQNSVR